MLFLSQTAEKKGARGETVRAGRQLVRQLLYSTVG
jgi:hypothetical protein